MKFEKYLQPLEDKINKEKSKEDAKAMEKYMRSQFPFLGVRKTVTDPLTKDFTKKYPFLKLDKLPEFINFLWEKEEREYQYIALKFLDMYKKKSSENYVQLYEKLIQEKSWWDTVDILATKLVGRLLKKYPELQKTYPEKWIKDENIWLQRTALLFQLKYKKETDSEKLFSFIQQKAKSKEFFIQKAIGWALREYSKTNSEAVLRFTKEQKLSPLSRREALRWLRKQHD